ncbi:MAG: hypothetical protein Q6363_010080 [Candidatus Njordarchaeota archaeon]
MNQISREKRRKVLEQLRFDIDKYEPKYCPICGIPLHVTWLEDENRYAKSSIYVHVEKVGKHTYSIEYDVTCQRWHETTIKPKELQNINLLKRKIIDVMITLIMLLLFALTIFVAIACCPGFYPLLLFF